MTVYKETMTQTLEFMQIMNEFRINERELTDTEQKRREEIAQDMDDADFKSRYGDRWKEVKMAVATKQAKNESVDEEVEESLNEDNMAMMRKAAKGSVQTLKMKDGKMKMDKVTASAVMQIYDKLNPANQKKMEQMINNGKKSGIIKVSDFAMSKVTGFKREDIELDEAKFRVSIDGLPNIYMDGNSAGQVKSDLRRLVKKPDMINDVERITPAEHKKDLRDKISGKNDEDDEESVEEDNLERAKEKEALAIKHKAEREREKDELGRIRNEGRQLKDPKKEMMVSKRGKVEVINKSDWDKYKKKGYVQAEEVELGEGKFQVKTAATKKGKITVTDFDNLKDAKKHLASMEKKGQRGIISKDGKPVKEVVDLGEVKVRGTNVGGIGVKGKGLPGSSARYKLPKGRPRGAPHIENERFWDLPKSQLDYIRKDAYDAMKANPTARKASGKWADEVNDAETVLYWRKKKGIKEEVDLDEGGAGHGPYRVTNPDLGVWTGNARSDADASEKAMRKWGVRKGAAASRNFMKKTTVKKEFDFLDHFEIDEGKMAKGKKKIKDKKTPEEIAKIMKLDVKTIKALMDDFNEKYTDAQRAAREKHRTSVDSVTGERGRTGDYGHSGAGFLTGPGRKRGVKKEAVDLDEISTMTQLTHKKVGRSVKKGHAPEGMYGRAAKDARRAMSGDPDLVPDRSDHDDSATEDDIRAADKNIIMQMRKVQSMKGRFAVEFGDRKKVKIPEKIAIAVQQKYNSFRRPADKEKFQAKVAKSYKDMLSALKESVDQETTLEWVNRQIKEIKEIRETT